MSAGMILAFAGLWWSELDEERVGAGERKWSETHCFRTAAEGETGTGRLTEPRQANEKERQPSSAVHLRPLGSADSTCPHYTIDLKPCKRRAAQCGRLFLLSASARSVSERTHV